MDPDNPIIMLCAQGMQAEGEGHHEDAAALFLEAWERGSDDYEKAIAAHYVARHQSTPEERLHWNLEGANRAEGADQEKVREFYPSLYLNLAHSYEQIGNPNEARRYYDLAAERLGFLPPGPYTDLVRRGIVAGRERVGNVG